jgi:hypothetical protein
MAKCKCCQIKGFMVETDVSGLCPACAPYYYLTMPDDLKALRQALQALSRIGKAEAALARIAAARSCLDRLRPYAWAGLVRLPQPPAELDSLLDQMAETWRASEEDQ